MTYEGYDDDLAAVEGYSRTTGATAEQGTAQWFAQRAGKCTCSRFKDATNFLKSGKESEKRAGYRYELVVERLTGQPTEHYVTAAMAWGAEHEDMARMAYEAMTGNIVARTGFAPHPTIAMCGGSVDGLIDDDGMIEIKCPTSREHIDTILTEDITEHWPQIFGYLSVTGRKWCDFVSYDPRMPDGLQVYIKRVPRDEKYIADMESKITAFLAEVAEVHAKLLKRTT